MTLKEFQNKFHDIVHILQHPATSFFLAAIHNVEASGGEILRQGASDAVNAAENAGGTAEDKFKAAYNSVVATLKANGLPLVENAIKLAIEAAVANLSGA